MRHATSYLGLLLLFFLTACDQPALTEADRAGHEASSLDDALISAGKATDDIVPGQYVVVFKNTVPQAAELATRLTTDQGGTLRYTYQHALKGFTARLSAQAVEALKNNPNVAYVEPDRYVYALETQANPPSWGLDRLDQRPLPLNASYTYDATGAGVTAYIIDTGIRTAHTAFGGRASVGFDAIGDGQNGQDCNGHGTHVAGTVGGALYGVAKNVALVAVRVLNCSGSGTWSQVIAGVDWVTANHAAPAVANMSLGGGAFTALDAAVANSIAAGVTYAVAAGNETTNACTRSPAHTPAALTVGSTTSTDARSSFSNYGSCVDLFAPGSGITSAWHTSNTAANTISGTSMASPHVAGVAALYLEANPGATPAAVAAALTGNATTGVVGNPGSGSPNLLLHSLFGSSPPPPPPPPATLTLTATGFTQGNKKKVDLAWSGAASTNVDIYRNGTKIKTTPNDGSHTDSLGNKATGTHTYQVCEAGTSTCSNTSSVAF